VSWTRSEFAAAELLGAGSKRMAGSSRYMDHPTAGSGSEEGKVRSWRSYEMNVEVYNFEEMWYS